MSQLECLLWMSENDVKVTRRFDPMCPEKDIITVTKDDLYTSFDGTNFQDNLFVECIIPCCLALQRVL